MEIEEKIQKIKLIQSKLLQLAIKSKDQDTIDLLLELPYILLDNKRIETVNVSTEPIVKSRRPKSNREDIECVECHKTYNVNPNVVQHKDEYICDFCYSKRVPNED